MKRLHLLLLSTLTLTSTSFGQSKIKSNKINKANTQITTIVGTWRLVEFTDLDTTSGKWIFRYGKNPKGYFTYTKSGIVNLNISSDNPLKISADSAKRFDINLFNFTNTNSVGYFGTYTVDLEKSIVTHHVKGGSLPWYIDTDQERPFSIKGDTLIINNNKTWKRVLVRVD
jgi:hypothetical protein